jgi:hypothetical protein
MHVSRDSSKYVTEQDLTRQYMKLLVVYEGRVPGEWFALIIPGGWLKPMSNYPSEQCGSDNAIQSGLNLWGHTNDR